MIFFKQKYPAHVPNITALHHAQFGEYGSLSTMVTIGGVESAPPLPRGKEDILKAAGIRVKGTAPALVISIDIAAETYPVFVFLYFC